MRCDTVGHKVKVFISSRCDGRYDLVRKSLKMLLEETNLTRVYLFETSTPSSQEVVISYIDELDDSDLCIFLIDNEDGVSEGVMREQKRARTLGKKSIYIFCDETKKEPSQVQKEIECSQGEKFKVVHSFSELIREGYRSAVQDIITIYRSYCKGRLIRSKEDSETFTSALSMDIFTVNKQLYSGFDLTRNTLCSVPLVFDNKMKATSTLDLQSSKLLGVVLGKNNVESIDFGSLVGELCQLHNEPVAKLVQTRFDAIVHYFNDKLEACYSSIETAYEQAVRNEVIPNWLINDILIDLRNIQQVIGETKGQLSINNSWQKLINLNKESVYYPVLDRFDSGFRKNVLSKYLSHIVDSPYTISFGGVEAVFEQIADAFVVAVLYGSLTHIIMTKERVIDALSCLCFVFDDHRMYIELMSCLVMCQKEKEIKKIARAYNQPTEMLNSDDINKMWVAAEFVPLKHKRTISKLIILEYYGYYLSDKLFDRFSNIVLKEVNDWIEDENRILSVGNHIFRSLKMNAGRLDNNEISRLIRGIFTNRLKRWYEDALDVMRNLDFSVLDRDEEESLINILLKLVRDKNCETIPSLQDTLVFVRRRSQSMIEELDECIKKNMESFFYGNYSLDVFPSNSESSIKHIDRYLKTIHKLNEEQGKDSKYLGWVENPYRIIIKIIEIDKPDIKWDDVCRIVDAIEGTLMSGLQTVSAKIHSLHLLMFLSNTTEYRKNIETIFSRWMVCYKEIISGCEDIIFYKDSLETLEFNILLLQLDFGYKNSNDLISSLSNFTQTSDYEVIQSLKSIKMLLYKRDLKQLNSTILNILTQYVIGMSLHNEIDARLISTHILCLLCQSSVQDSVLMRLSKIMDNDSFAIKIALLKRISLIRGANPEIADLVIKKGKADNHYLVRKITEDIIERSEKYIEKDCLSD